MLSVILARKKVWSARACGPLGGRGLRVEAVDEARAAEALLGVGDERQQRPPRARPGRRRGRGGRVGGVHRAGRTVRGARKWGSVKNGSYLEEEPFTYRLKK